MSASHLLKHALHLATNTVSAAIDRSYLDSVRDNFGSFGLSPSNLRFIIWTIATGCLAAGIVMLLNHFVYDRKRKKLPSAAVEDKSQVTKLMELALSQRSKLEVGFSLPEHGVKPMSCSIEEVKRDNLHIELPSYITPKSKWIGRTVNCYFKVKESANADPSFYNFATEIAGVTRQEGNISTLTLPIPDSVALQQKRVHLRMEPPMRYMLGVALWPEQLDPTGVPIATIKKWDKPTLIYHHGKQDHLTVANISAGGMRVDIPRRSLRDSGLEFEIGQILHLLADMHDPEKDTKTRLWATVRVQNRFEDIENSRFEIGLKFSHFGHLVGDGDKSKVTWRKVGPEGIMPVGNWVFQRHLEIVRRRQSS